MLWLTADDPIQIGSCRVGIDVVIIGTRGRVITVKIFSVEFVKSCLAPDDYPEGDFPEIAFVGRSNVGKSSVINALLGHRRIARVSSTPGKTRLIYFFRVNKALHFVDLPGYGYARVPKDIKASWVPSIEYYLKQRRQLRGVVLLLDARHPPTDLDLQMKAWLEAAGIRFLVVITKIDKISHGDQRRSLEGHRAALGLSSTLVVFPFSAKTGAGKDLLWRSIERLLAHPSSRYSA